MKLKTFNYLDWIKNKKQTIFCIHKLSLIEVYNFHESMYRDGPIKILKGEIIEKYGRTWVSWNLNGKGYYLGDDSKLLMYE